MATSKKQFLNYLRGCVAAYERFEDERKKRLSELKEWFETWTEADYRIYVVKCELQDKKPEFTNQSELAVVISKMMNWQEKKNANY